MRLTKALELPGCEIHATCVSCAPGGIGGGGRWKSPDKGRKSEAHSNPSLFKRLPGPDLIDSTAKNKCLGSLSLPLPEKWCLYLKF